MEVLLLVLLLLTGASAQWRLAWSEEFNVDGGLDTTKWTVRDRVGNLGNGELQWYSPSQVYVHNGSLVVNATKQNYMGLNYTSGWCDTQDKAYFTYGRFETRAKMAPGKGMWPAIWMLSEDHCWPYGVEFDLMEFRGSYPQNIAANYHYGTTCCPSWANNCVTSESTNIDTNIDLTADYHTYTMEWWPTNISWSYDGKAPFYTVQSSDVTKAAFETSPHYWIVNSAMGGSYAGDPDRTTVFPNFQYYLRVYVWRPSCSSSNVCSGHGCCDENTILCNCNAGWAGTNCEYWLGGATHTFSGTSSLEVQVNGWGTYALYLTANCAFSNGLTLTISNSGCPSGCGNLNYSAGAWTSLSTYSYGTFSFMAKSTSVSGTALSLAAVGGNETVLQQISFSLAGVNKTQAQLISWTSQFQYIHATIDLGTDLSQAYHNYTIVYWSTGMSWIFDGTVLHTASVVVPVGLLGLGAYYTADPAWYGPFSYHGPYSVYLSSAAWQTAPGVATCATTTSMAAASTLTAAVASTSTHAGAIAASTSTNAIAASTSTNAGAIAASTASLATSTAAHASVAATTSHSAGVASSTSAAATSATAYTALTTSVAQATSVAATTSHSAGVASSTSAAATSATAYAALTTSVAQAASVAATTSHSAGVASSTSAAATSATAYTALTTSVAHASSVAATTSHSAGVASSTSAAATSATAYAALTTSVAHATSVSITTASAHATSVATSTPTTTHSTTITQASTSTHATTTVGITTAAGSQNVATTSASGATADSSSIVATTTSVTTSTAKISTSNPVSSSLSGPTTAATTSNSTHNNTQASTTSQSTTNSSVPTSTASHSVTTTSDITPSSTTAKSSSVPSSSSTTGSEPSAAVSQYPKPFLLCFAVIIYTMYKFI